MKEEVQHRAHKQPENKEYYAIISDWQHGIMRVNLLLIVLMFVIEVVFMIALHATGEISTSIMKYIPRYVLRPLFVNVVVYVVLSMAFRSNDVRNSFKAMIPLVLMTLVLSNMLVVHYVFPAVYLVLIVPLFMTTIYGSMKITRNMFYILMPVYIFSILQVILIPYYVLPESFVYNAVIGFLSIPLSYLIVRNIVMYENQKQKLVEEQYNENRELEREALYDGLTGILNHTGLYRVLESEIENYKKDRGLYLAVLDIDYFKQVNDDFGHETGNRVLEKLGEMLRNYTNDNVSVARYGGEEFCVVFTNMKDYEATRILRDMHREFQTYSYEDIDRKVTFSAGIATFTEDLTASAFIDKADQALYIAKNSGRNCVVTG